jgi:hypothetical protein
MALPHTIKTISPTATLIMMTASIIDMIKPQSKDTQPNDRV